MSWLCCAVQLYTLQQGRSVYEDRVERWLGDKGGGGEEGVSWDTGVTEQQEDEAADPDLHPDADPDSDADRSPDADRDANLDADHDADTNPDAGVDFTA